MSILTTKIVSNYDEEDDILYLSIGKPTPSITTETDDGILIRKEKGSNKITGVTILDYKYKKSNNIKMKLPKEIDLKLINIKI